jgi:hypothetical protein
MRSLLAAVPSYAKEARGIELSYWDSEMIKRRREVLQAWADFIKPRKDTSSEQPPERKRQKLKLVSSSPNEAHKDFSERPTACRVSLVPLSFRKAP